MTLKSYKFITSLLGFIFISMGVQAQENLEIILNFDGNERTFLVYIPSSYDESNAAPLLFNFHGGSGDIDSQLAISDMRSFADQEGFILVYPQAWPDPNDGGSTNWTHKQPTTHDDIFFIEAIIDELSLEFSIDNNRVYACGYSNGGEFTFELACKLSHRIAAIGVVARSMFIETFDNCAPVHPTAVVTIHGTKDEYEGIEWFGTLYYVSLDDVNNFWSNFNKTDTTPTINTIPDINTNDGSTVEHFSWTDGENCVSVEHFKVINGGHDWPGSFGNMDINASQEIWKFVSQYDINGLIDCNTTHIFDGNKQALKIHPNPINDFVFVERASTEELDYQIFSTDGTKVKIGKINSNPINIGGLNSGFYYFKVGKQIVKLVKI